MQDSEEESLKRKIDDLMILKSSDRNKMVQSFKEKLTDEETKFFKKIIKDNPDGEWATTITNSTPLPYHFMGGMAVRNYFRSNGFDEKSLGIDNLDNIYSSIVEEAVNSIPEGYKANKSFFSKIKSFFW